MIYALAHRRYLAAVGFSTLPVVIVSAACTPDPAPVTAVSSDSAHATATAAPTATAAAPTATAAAPTATAAAPAASAAPPPTHHTAAWEPSPDPEPVGGRLRVGRCPSTLFCVPPPATPGPDPADAPYQSCANVVPGPSGLVAKDLPRPPTIRFDAATTARERASDPAACCYRSTILCVGGRALRGVEGPAPVVARPARRDDWRAPLEGLAAEGLAPAIREALAAHWEREAAFEHASVAAFARASLGLLAVGAPPDLVTQTHAAAMDEVEHARLGYALASAYGGAPVGPAALATGALAPVGSLASLAAETLLDACAGESVAALALREAAVTAESLVLRRVLGQIAADEERHAELAWRTVAWALGVGGSEVADAVLAALDELRAELADLRAPLAAEAPDLARHGVLGAAAARAVRRRALREVVLPCAEALLGVPCA